MPDQDRPLVVYFGWRSAFIALAYGRGGRGSARMAAHAGMTWWNPVLSGWVALRVRPGNRAGQRVQDCRALLRRQTIALMLGGRTVIRTPATWPNGGCSTWSRRWPSPRACRCPPVVRAGHEPGINAFAAGYQPGDAVVAVSGGCAAYLTREELQGVLGHEFSHILNGDMRLNSG